MNQESSPESTQPANSESEANKEPLTPVQESSPIAQQFSEQPAKDNSNGAASQQLPTAFELFSYSKKAVQLNFIPFLFIGLLPALLAAAANVAGGHSDWVRNFSHSPHGISSGFISLWALAGLFSLLTIAARPWLEVLSAKNQTTTFGDTFSKGLHYFWRMLGLEVLIGLIVVGGLILLIVPGIIFLRRYFLAPYFMVDQDLGIRESLRKSSTATKGHSGAIWGVIGVGILLGLTNVVPVLGPFIAAILTWLYSCAPAFRYQQLKG